MMARIATARTVGESLGRYVRWWPALGWTLLAWAVGASAAENAAVMSADWHTVYVVRPTSGPVRVDGSVTQAEWAGAIAVAGFRLQAGGAFPRGQCLLRLQYDYEALYLAAMCYEEHLDRLVATSQERDADLTADDSVHWSLRQRREGAPTMHLAVNAAGAMLDLRDRDVAWNPQWEAVTGRTRQAWTVEAKIPFASLETAMPALLDLWDFAAMRVRRAGLPEPEVTEWIPVGVAQAATPAHLLFVHSPMPAGTSPFDGLTERLGGSAWVFGEAGYVELEDAPRIVPYAQLLADRLAAESQVTEQLAQLQEVYTAHPELDTALEFWRLHHRWEELSRNITRPRAVSALGWVWGLLDIGELSAALRALFEGAQEAGLLKGN